VLDALENAAVSIKVLSEEEEAYYAYIGASGSSECSARQMNGWLHDGAEAA
jgi:exopolyphosphatase/pppGpp-phosphohydrolase